MNTKELNNQFGIKGQVEFLTGNGGLTLAQITGGRKGQRADERLMPFDNPAKGVPVSGEALAD